MNINLSFARCSLALGTCLLSGAPALAAVNVYGTASSAGPTITVTVYADVTDTSVLSFGVNLHYPSTALRLISATNNPTIWHFSDGTRQLNAGMPDTSLPGEVILVGGHMDGTNPLAGVCGSQLILGTVSFARLSAAPPAFTVAMGPTRPFANFVTSNGTVLDHEVGAVVFQGVFPNPNDQDLDGLADAWEMEHFGAIARYGYDDDPDGDGFGNRAEQAAGSDPADPASNLRLTVRTQPEGIQFEWRSAPGRVYTIEASSDLQHFLPLASPVPATPPVNSFLLRGPLPAGSACYRLRLELPGS